MKLSTLIRQHYYWIAVRVTTVHAISMTATRHLHQHHNHRLSFCSLSLLRQQQQNPSIINNKRTLLIGSTTTTSIIIDNNNDSSNSDNDNIMSSVPSAASLQQSQFQCYHIQHAPNELIPEWMKVERTRILTKCRNITTTSDKDKNGCVVYWMQRDVRTVDNWALLWSCYLAQKYNVPLRAMYVLQPPPVSDTTTTTNNNNNDVPNLQNLPMTTRHGQFILGGLESVHEQLSKYNIPLHIVMSPSHEQVGETVCEYINKWNPISIICDMSPIRHYREWIEIQTVPILNKKYPNIPMYQVDAHNVIPVWIASIKREYGARTLRIKINKLIDLYLKPYPDNTPILSSCNKEINIKIPEFDRTSYEEYMQMDDSVGLLSWAKPGNDAGMKQFHIFINNGLSKFSILRNDPNQCPNICSQLSPWINHGHISFQTLGNIVKKLNKYATGTASYLEEGIVRRELSDNFVFYEPFQYDTIYSAYEWAIETLQTHSIDTRENIYNIHDLEIGNTHDDLWNAAQLQAVRHGKMHGYLRMYWAKKILEWTISPEQALIYGHYLNDKYNLDGRDPNGFVGVNWCIIGIHDQGWAERSIFGKIRYMNYAGCKRKFNITEFVAKYPGAAENAAKVIASKNKTTTASDGVIPTKKKQQTKMTAFTTTSPPKVVKPIVAKGTKSLKQQTKMTAFTTTTTKPAVAAKGTKSLTESTTSKRKTTMTSKSSSPSSTASITSNAMNKKSKK